MINHWLLFHYSLLSWMLNDNKKKNSKNVCLTLYYSHFKPTSAPFVNATVIIKCTCAKYSSFACLNVFFFKTWEDFPELSTHSRSVCGGPCPWGLLFWFNSAPHGWTQSDTSNPVKGDAQWSWSYTTAAPRRKRRPGSQTMFTCKDTSSFFFFFPFHSVETTQHLNFRGVNKVILTCWHG